MCTAHCKTHSSMQRSCCWSRTLHYPLLEAVKLVALQVPDLSFPSNAPRFSCKDRISKLMAGWHLSQTTLITPVCGSKDCGALTRHTLCWSWWRALSAGTVSKRPACVPSLVPPQPAAASGVSGSGSRWLWDPQPMRVPDQRHPVQRGQSGHWYMRTHSHHYLLHPMVFLEAMPSIPPPLRWSSFVNHQHPQCKTLMEKFWTHSGSRCMWWRVPWPDPRSRCRPCAAPDQWWAQAVSWRAPHASWWEASLAPPP